MKTTTSLAGLEKEVRRLVREHMASYEQSVKQAVERGLGLRSPSRNRGRSAKSRTPEAAAALAAQAEKLYEKVCLLPGSPMALLAVELNRSSSDLYRPMQGLKKAGRVRSAGERQFTRYFPMATPSSA